MNKQQIIAKYGKKFVSTSETTPVLMGVHYAAGGTVYATNRHYGIRIRNAHNFEQALTLDAKTGALIEGTYPDMSKIFPGVTSMEIELLPAALESVVKRVAMAVDVVKRIDKKVPLLKLDARNGSVNLNISNQEHGLEFTAFFGNTDVIESSVRSLNGEYLLTALQLFNDAGRGVTLMLSGPMSPIVLTDGGDIDVITLPYRTTD
ncbi:MAG: hypothetical protein ACE3L7_25625 [Candidatus Pristimantibacillus sp.]